eukprot:s2002_g3.t1
MDEARTPEALPVDKSPANPDMPDGEDKMAVKKTDKKVADGVSSGMKRRRKLPLGPLAKKKSSASSSAFLPATDAAASSTEVPVPISAPRNAPWRLLRAGVADTAASGESGAVAAGGTVSVTVTANIAVSATPCSPSTPTVNPYVAAPAGVSSSSSVQDGSRMDRGEPGGVAEGSAMPAMPTLPAARVKAAAPHPQAPVHRALACFFFCLFFWGKGCYESWTRVQIFKELMLKPAEAAIQALAGMMSVMVKAVGSDSGGSMVSGADGVDRERLSTLRGIETNATDEMKKWPLGFLQSVMTFRKLL